MCFFPNELAAFQVLKSKFFMNFSLLLRVLNIVPISLFVIILIILLTKEQDIMMSVYLTTLLVAKIIQNTVKYTWVLTKCLSCFRLLNHVVVKRFGATLCFRLPGNPNKLSSMNIEAVVCPGTWRYLTALNTKRRLLYLKTQFVPRSKHFSSRL